MPNQPQEKKPGQQSNVKPNPGQRPTAQSLGTGGAPVPDMVQDYDPNVDMSRAEAIKTAQAKQAMGEDAGDLPEAPVSMAAKHAVGPTGPVPQGHKRVRVKSTVAAGRAGTHHAPGTVLDVSEEDFKSLGEHVEEVGPEYEKMLGLQREQSQKRPGEQPGGGGQPGQPGGHRPPGE